MQTIKLDGFRKELRAMPISWQSANYSRFAISASQAAASVNTRDFLTLIRRLGEDEVETGEIAFVTKYILSLF